jgi:transposase
MPCFAGLDWGAGRHAVCVVDEQGKVVARFEVAHDAEGLMELRRKLARHGSPETLPLAIERPSGVIVDTLVDAGHPVVPIHPNVVKACRPRYRAAGGKDDRGDAYLLADVLRTDGHRLQPLRPSSDEIKALRALVRTRDDLVAQRVSLANQLRALLESFWPGGAAIFADVDSPIALCFLARYPTPQSATRLGEKRLAAFLAKHAYSGGRRAPELLERLHAAPTGLCGEAEADAKGELVRALVAVLERLVTELARLTTRVEHAVAALGDGRIVMSFPRAGRVCAAQILAELGDERARFPSEEHLAAEAGVTPVTHASGKQRGVVFRWACNKRLRRAITCFADNSRHNSSWACAVYASARARGCDHSHAIRILARAWVRVLWRAWHDRTLYDPARHRGALRRAPVVTAQGG